MYIIRFKQFGEVPVSIVVGDAKTLRDVCYLFESVDKIISYKVFGDAGESISPNILGIGDVYKWVS